MSFPQAIQDLENQNEYDQRTIDAAREDIYTYEQQIAKKQKIVEAAYARIQQRDRAIGVLSGRASYEPSK